MYASRKALWVLGIAHKISVEEIICKTKMIWCLYPIGKSIQNKNGANKGKRIRRRGHNSPTYMWAKLFIYNAGWTGAIVDVCPGSCEVVTPGWSSPEG